MQDPRVRLLCACLLSLAAFASLAGAIAVFVWWLVFTTRLRSIRNRTAVLMSLCLFGIIAGVLSLCGNDGISYLVRMTAILLVGTWLFGTRIGFELGMIAGMALQVASGLSEDVGRIRIAARQKGQPWGIRSIVPVGRVLIYDTLRRADETAAILAMRGYRNGGTLCPSFHTTLRDGIAGICAAVALVLACLPVSEFFILYR